eukprot:tig00020553_g10684.t1
MLEPEGSAGPLTAESELPEHQFFKTSYAVDWPCLRQQLRNIEQRIYTVGDLFRATALDVHRATDVPLEYVKDLMRGTAELLVGAPTTALEMKAAPLLQLRLSTGCPILDELLHSEGAAALAAAADPDAYAGERPPRAVGEGGGLLCASGITEVSGESASGKTQLCLQLLMQVQLGFADGGLDGKAIYICSEDFPGRRMADLAAVYAARYPYLGSATDISNSIYVEMLPPTGTADELESLALHRLSGLLSTQKEDCSSAAPPRLFLAGTSGPRSEAWTPLTSPPGPRPPSPLPPPPPVPRQVRLVVLDSVAAVFRGDPDASDRALITRSETLFRVANALKGLSRRHAVPVVVVNQVNDAVEDRAARDPGPFGIPRPYVPPLPRSSGIRKVPALGVTWSSCVNSRVFLTRSDAPPSVPALPGPGGHAPGAVQPPRRMAYVILSPHLPPRCCEFVVDSEGVRGVPDTLYEF